MSSHQSSEQRVCSQCGQQYTASVEYRPDDHPRIVRSDIWLDGHLYCYACLDRLEADSGSLVPIDALSNAALLLATEEAWMRAEGYSGSVIADALDTSDVQLRGTEPGDGAVC